LRVGPIIIARRYTYGLMIASRPVIGSNLVCLALSLCILALRLRFPGRPAKTAAQRPAP
jgi:hypothetical protein